MSDYFGISYSFLQLSTLSIDEMEKQGNLFVIILDGNISEEEASLQYNEMTKWSDFRIAIPVLFNFYHGLELYMKAIIYRQQSDEKKHAHHKLTELLGMIKNPDLNVPDSIVLLLENQLTKSSPFHNFFEENDLSVDGYYEALRYPESNPPKRMKSVIKPFQYRSLRNKSGEGLQNFLKVRDAIKSLREETILWMNK